MRGFDTGALHYGRYKVEVEGGGGTVSIKPANMQRLGPLPPGWQEMPCPEGTYYYSDSGVSTWDRPRA